jgi:hypothetical protein
LILGLPPTTHLLRRPMRGQASLYLFLKIA